MDARKIEEASRFPPRRSLGIKLELTGQFRVFVFNGKNPYTGQTTPYRWTVKSAFDEKMLELFHAYRELEAEIASLLQERDSLANENAALRGDVERIDGLANHLKGQVSQQASQLEAVGSSASPGARRKK